MNDDRQSERGKTSTADEQEADRDRVRQEEADFKSTDGRSDDGNKAEESAQNETTESTDDSDGNDDVIHVAQTPTNPALLTQLKHDREYGEARALGAGHTGSAIFHMQRITAVALIPLAVWFVIGLISMSSAPRAQAAAWLAWPVNAVLMALFIVIGVHHAAIGIRIVLEDYVRDLRWRVPCVLAVRAIEVVVIVVSLAALIHLALL